MKHTHHDRRRSYATLFLACLFLLGRLAGDLHLASVRHAICPEHGELVEAGHAAPALLPAPHRDQPLDERARTCEVVPASGSEDHSHCLLAQLVRERPLLLDLAPARAVLAVSATPHLDEPRRVVVEAIPRFLLAPKHSPPLERRTIG